MNLLLSPKIVSYYLNSAKKIGKTEKEIIILSIFENKNNKFILNKSLLNQYENEFKEDSQELEVFRTQFAYLINERAINIGSDKNDLVQILEDTHSKYLSGKNDFETYAQLSIDKEDSLKNKFSGILSEIDNIIGKDYLYFNLAAYNPRAVTFRNYNFTNNEDIKNVFSNLYNLKTKPFVDIFDRNINLSHIYYDVIKSDANVQVNYYTKNLHNIRFVLDDNLILKSKFNRIKIFRSASNDLHERRLMFNTIIVEVDNDLQNVTFDNNTWKIDIYLCSIIKSQIDRKKRLFKIDNR